MFSEKTHRYIFLFGISSLFLGLMLGTVPTSVPQFILLGNWLLEGRFGSKWHQIKSNKVFWALASLFIIHVIGLTYTSDLQAGWNDVRTKIPLLLIPLILFSTDPLKKNEFYLVLYSFILGSLINISWCFIYEHFIAVDSGTRDLSRFMSHIRLGFLIDLAIFFCIYFFLEEKKPILRSGYLLLIGVFIYSLIDLGLFSGLTNLCIVSAIYLSYILFKKNKAVFILYLLLIGSSAYLLFQKSLEFYSSNFIIKNVEVNTIKKHTPSGRTYNNYFFTSQIENGYLVARNYELSEIQHAWNERFPNDTFNIEQKHNMTRYFILMRYMTSKGLAKDSLSFTKLTDSDFMNISENITNVNFKSWNRIQRRLYELYYEYYEYIHHGVINGHSFTMRLFFLKAAKCAIEKSPLFGCGTGDVQSTMNECYMESSSPLNKEWYKRPHNQFITIWVALGLVGLLIFIYSLMFPVFNLWSELKSLFWLFFLSALISFLFEDTLETQSGLSFFAFFNALFLSRAYFKKKEILQD